MASMSADPPISEGFVPFRGHRTWYRVIGDPFQPLDERDSFHEVVERFLGLVAGGAA
jgi:hypothetical protein